MYTQQAEAIAKKTIFSQLVTWNGDSYDIPLWMLQTGTDVPVGELKT